MKKLFLGTFAFFSAFLLAHAVPLRVLEVDYATPPTTNQFIKFNGTNWLPHSLSSSDIPDPLTVDDLNVADDLTVTGHTETGTLEVTSSTILDNVVISSTVNLGAVTASRPLKVDIGKEVIAAQINLASTDDVTNVLDETNGGTGQSTITQGDLLYGSASNTLSKLAKDANATRYLSNTGSSNNPAWAQVNLSNGVTGTLPVANGGTGLTAIGSVGQVLRTNNSSALEWSDDDWRPASGSWSRSDGDTFTVPSGATSLYRVGDKIRWKDGGSFKYNIITAVSSTTVDIGSVTLLSSTPQSIAVGTITEVSISRSDNPFGFPTVFEWSPNFVGFSSSPTDSIHLFRVRSGIVTIYVYHGTGGTSNATTFRLSLPISAKSVTNGHYGVATWYCADNSVALSVPCGAIVGPGGSSVTLVKTIASGSASWTASGAKGAAFTLEYPMFNAS